MKPYELKSDRHSKWVDLDVIQSIDAPSYEPTLIKIYFHCAFRSEPDSFSDYKSSQNLERFTKIYEDFVTAWKNRDTINNGLLA